MDKQLHIKFWGVRGTLPSPGPETKRYGGNTSCVEVYVEGDPSSHIILDAGTGIARCGQSAWLRGQRNFTVLMSHMHYDHILGLIRFTPFFRKDCKISICGHDHKNETFEQIMAGFFKHPYFPVSYDLLPAKDNISFKELLSENSLSIGEFKIVWMKLFHPQDAWAYKITWQGKTVVYATDHETGTPIDDELVKFSHKADLFIFDSTYSTHQYDMYQGWGHSTSRAGAIFAKDAQVDQYYIFHHEVDSSDEFLENIILPEARDVFQKSFLAKEGETIILQSA